MRKSAFRRLMNGGASRPRLTWTTMLSTSNWRRKLFEQLEDLQVSRRTAPRRARLVEIFHLRCLEAKAYIRLANELRVARTFLRMRPCRESRILQVPFGGQFGEQFRSNDLHRSPAVTAMYAVRP